MFSYFMLNLNGMAIRPQHCEHIRISGAQGGFTQIHFEKRLNRRQRLWYF